MQIKQKSSLIIFLMEVKYNKLIKRNIDDIKNKIFSFESGLHKIILFNEDTESKTIKCLFSVSHDSSVELASKFLKYLLSKYDKKINLIFSFPKSDCPISHENSYTLILNSKKDYFKDSEICSKIENEFPKIIEKKTCNMRINSLKISRDSCLEINFSLNEKLSVDSAIDIIKTATIKVIKNKNQRHIDAWGDYYICTNYINLSCESLHRIIIKFKTQKEINGEISKIFNDSNVFIEQFSIFGKLAAETS